MKLVFLLLLVVNTRCFSQKFGVSQILVYPAPANNADMLYYNWYEHPCEDAVYVNNFERSSAGLEALFRELDDLLVKSNLSFGEYHADASKFENAVVNDGIHTLQTIHYSVINNKSSVLRIWNVGSDYLTLLLKEDVYMLILGNKR